MQYIAGVADALQSQQSLPERDARVTASSNLPVASVSIGSDSAVQPDPPAGGQYRSFARANSRPRTFRIEHDPPTARLGVS
jgi:hypothetical protein